MKKLKTSHRKRSFKSLNAEIFRSFLLFTMSFLIVLTLFQIFFLDINYKMIRVSTIKKTAEKIGNVYQSDVDKNTLRNIITDEDISAIIINSTKNSRVDINIAKMGEALSDLNAMDIAFLGNVLSRRDDVTVFVTGDSLNRKFSISDSYDNSLKIYQEKAQAVFYASRFENAENDRLIVIVSSSIVPVEATVSTLKLQLVFIAIIEIIIAVILSFLLSRKIARPIEQLTADARVMATGNYDVNFDSKGYDEIDELSRTLNYTAKELKKADQLSKDLIANVSHDLRTPLSMISGYGEIIRDIPGENTAENVQVIIDEANRLASLVNNLLDISKLQSGNLSLNINEINGYDFICSVISNYRKLIENKNITIEINAEESDCYIKADKEKLVQVIVNLLNNAVNHVGEDRLIIVNYRIVDNNALFEVIDHGEGIRDEDKQLIWERYYKVDKEHKRDSTGSGLGLSIVKTILELHHADYGVESEIGKGSNFYFSLPVSQQGEIINLDE